MFTGEERRVKLMMTLDEHSQFAFLRDGNPQTSLRLAFDLAKKIQDFECKKAKKKPKNTIGMGKPNA